MGKLEGKVALVTGAGRGIGRAIAGKLWAEGARLVANDLDADPLEACVGALGAEALAFPGDVTEPGFGERFVEAALDRFGGLDIIVNNAGYIWNSSIAKTSDAQWQAMAEVHGAAPFRILRAAAPHLRATAAREREAGAITCRKVVNISSISGLGGAATQVAYAMAKASIVGLTRTLAKEWGRYNVTVNAVAFGHIATRLTEAYDERPGEITLGGGRFSVGLSTEQIRQMTDLTPLGRAGTVEDGAGAVVLLCLPEADFVTGQILVCDGGLTL